jgi:type II secretory pathway pseudopilin PulG
MTLIELIVGMMIALIVIGLAGGMIIFSSNLLNQSSARSNEQVSATSVAQTISDQIRLADSIKIVYASVPPTDLPDNTKIIYIGNDDGTAITSSGYMYLWDDEVNSPYNYYGGADYYNGAKVSMKYSAFVPADNPKYFELKVTAQNRKGDSTKSSTKSYELVNADATASPLTGEAADSLTTNYYLEFHFATNYGDYTQDALLVHLDGFNKYGYGFGRGSKDPSDKTKWKNLAPDDNYNNIGAIDFTLSGQNGTSPIIDKRSLYFSGAQWGVSNQALNFSGLPAVTVEVVFKEAQADRGGMLWEYSTNWNSVAGGFGVYLNTLSSGATTHDIVHTNSRFNGSMPRNYEFEDSNQVVQTHTNVFSVVVDSDGRQTYVDAVKKILMHSEGGANTGYSGTSPTNTPTGSFGSNNMFFIASRNTGSNFAGDIYCIRIYGKKLTQEEIDHNYKTDLLRYQNREFG